MSLQKELDMNLNLNVICKDPLFQLNLAIWMTQSQPSTYFYIYPLFYESGLNIYSIGPLVALPPDIRLVVSDKIACQESARPDLVLELKEKKRLCILECKSSSFGSESSASNQARTFLLLAGPIISEVLGSGKRGENEGILCYFIGPNNSGLMDRTLEILAKEIKDKTNFETSRFGCFEIRPSKSTIALEYSEPIKNFLNLVKDSPVDIIKFEEDTDPRPLYLIPYDPNVNQTKEEQEFCRRVLFERILSHIISNIGSADIPTSITFTTAELLNLATFGVYEIWDDTDAKKHIRKLVRDFLINIKNSMDVSVRECLKFEAQKGWIFNIENKEKQEELLKHLQRFKPGNLDLSKKIGPILFDDLENEL